VPPDPLLGQDREALSEKPLDEPGSRRSAMGGFVVESLSDAYRHVNPQRD
jgi:hypothetical protein